MQIQLICMGQKMPDWVNSGYLAYAKRFPPHCHLELVEIPLQKRGKGKDLVRLQKIEGEKMLAALPKNAHIIALDERGKAWTTQQLAEQLDYWLKNYPHIALLVGSPEGLAPACVDQADQCWSLSPLTLPHPLVRVIVAEQLYRAWSVLNHHPYHRQ